MTQATALMTIWPRVALFNYFAVPMPFVGTATAQRLPLDWTSSRLGGEFYGSADKPEGIA